MPISPEKPQFFAEDKPEKEDKRAKEKEAQALELVKEIKSLESKEKQTEEDLKRTLELYQKIERLFELKEFKLEGELTEKDVIAEYQAKGEVLAANFSPDGEKVVIGSGDEMMRVFE